MRMAIDAGGRTVGCPSSMSDASVRIEDLGLVGIGLSNELLELGYFANLLEGKDFILLVSIDS